MLHDKATTSQPLGRCFDSRGGWRGVGGGESSGPLQVLAAERMAKSGEIQLRIDPLPLRAPLRVFLRGGRQRFSATPSKCGVLRAGEKVGMGGSQQAVCSRSQCRKRA